nr:hypothetical protein [uncultured Brevundimonas sp.]
MSLTFNLILALFLLAPGLGMFAGLYTGARGPFRPAAAEPGSIHALAIVSIGALLCHAIWAWALVGMESYCGSHACFQVSFDPNPYEIILELRETLSARSATIASGQASTGGLSPGGVAWLFTSLLLIGFFGFLVGLEAVWLIARTGFMRSTVFGWVDELLQGADSKAYVFTAFVLTDTEHDGLLVGYEGSLIDMRQSPSGEIKVVVLKDAEPFVVKVSADSARRQPEPAGSDGPKEILGVLTIEGAHIKNIAFRPYLDPRKLSDKQYKRLMEAGELDVKPRRSGAVSGTEVASAAAGVRLTRARRPRRARAPKANPPAS